MGRTAKATEYRARAKTADAASDSGAAGAQFFYFGKPAGSNEVTPMGYEYMLDFEIEKPDEVAAILRSIPGFEHYDPTYALYCFRRKATGAMPDAHVKIEPRGLYLCDNGCGFDVLQDVRAAMAPLAPGLTLREL